MKILIKVNIGTKVSYLKLKQNSFEILCEEENVKIITVARFKVMQIFRLRKYSFTNIPSPWKLGAETQNQEEAGKRDESVKVYIHKCI